MVVVTVEQVEEFQQSGVVCIREAFSSQWVEKIREGINAVLADPSEYSESLMAEEGAGKYFNDYGHWRRIAQFVDFVYNSEAAEIVGKLLQSEEVAFYHEHVLIKEAATNKKTPWHVDQTYYPINGDKACSIWMPLDPVSMDATIEFVAGTHLREVLYRPRKFASSQNYPLLDGADDQQYEDVPDVEAQRDSYVIKKWAVEPGDIIVFHMKTLHGAPENLQPIQRRVFSTRWLGDDCVIAQRPWTTSPPMAEGLNIGEKAMCEEFPKVWSRSRQLQS